MLCCVVSISEGKRSRVSWAVWSVHRTLHSIHSIQNIRSPILWSFFSRWSVLSLLCLLNTHPITHSLPWAAILYIIISAAPSLSSLLYPLFSIQLLFISCLIFPHFTVSFLKSSEHFSYQPIPLLFCLLILPYPIPPYPVLPSQTTSVYCTALHQRTEWLPCPSLWGRASTFS